jgi:hypothetical protein
VDGIIARREIDELVRPLAFVPVPDGLDVVDQLLVELLSELLFRLRSSPGSEPT